jgi:hypothetical protein
VRMGWRVRRKFSSRPLPGLLRCKVGAASIKPSGPARREQIMGPRALSRSYLANLLESGQVGRMPTRARLAASLSLGILVLALGLLAVKLYFDTPREPRTLLSDLQNLASVAAGQRWRDNLDFTRPLPPAVFPEVGIVDQALWDWQEHAILWGQRRVSYWENSSSSVTISLIGTVSSVTFGPGTYICSSGLR